MPQDWAATLGDAYHHLTFHIVPGPNSITYFIPLLLLPLALCIPPSALSRFRLSCLFLPPIYACVIHTWIWGGGIDVISVNVILWSSDLIAFQDIRHFYRRIHVAALEPYSENQDHIRQKAKELQISRGEVEPLVQQTEENSSASAGSDKETWEETYPESLYARLGWVLTLLISIRLSYWKIGDVKHDRAQPPQRLTRLAFLRWAASVVVWSYLVLDTAAFYARHDTYFIDPSIGVDNQIAWRENTPQFLTLMSYVPPRILRSATIAAHIYGVISFGGALGIPIIVLVNYLGLISDLWSPQSWPIFFGPFSAVSERGVRGLWGDWWHQTMRHSTSIPGRALASACRVPAYSLLDYTLRTISAFFFSGIVHMGLVPPEPQHATMSTWYVRLFVAGFFWLQILSFAVEIVVSRLLRRFYVGWRPTLLTRIATLIWVSAWLCICLPVVGVGLKQLGYGGVYPLPISLWNGLIRQHWVMWSI
ncbi:hypothetical protein MMC25_003763 [Agyrium rufum]|nr:hypothetical protein [Agyrium rufum]